MKKLWLLFFSFFLVSAYPQYLSQRVIETDNVKYLSNTLIIKLKNQTVQTKGMTNSIQLIQAQLNQYNISEVKQLFPALENKQYANELIRYIEIKYESTIDPLELASKIKKMSDIEWAEPRFVYDLAYTPNDPSFSQQAYLNRIKAPEAWDVTRGDTTIAVAIIDTGVDWDHPDLAANIWINRFEIPNNNIDDDNNGFIDDIRGWDFGGLTGTADNNPMEDRPDHGTHVAGLSSAVTDNGVGVASIGFRTKIMAVKTSQDNFRNNLGQALIAFGFEGIVYAAQNRAKVINCSWGGSGYSLYAQDIINFATRLGSLVVCAAGNNNSQEIFYPSGYNNVLAVGSTTVSDVKSSFSNFGTYIDVMSPGSDIYNTWQNNTYATLSGTSMSSPIAAGLAALVFARFPNLTPVQVKERIRVTSDDIYSLNSGTFAGLLGKGRINAQRAVTETNLISARITETIFSDVGTGDGDGIFEPNELINVGIRVTSILGPTTNLSLTLQSRTTSATVVNGNYTPGTIALNDTANNFASRFTFRISATVAQNADLRFQIIFADGSYSDFQWINTVGNPSFATQSGNNVALTITSKGTLGFNNYPTNNQGIGFKYREGLNNLFEGALMIATSNTRVSDNARNATGTAQNADFSTVLPFLLRIPGTVSDVQGSTIFTDASATNPIRVNVRLNSYSFTTAAHQNFIILQFNIKNNNATAISNLFAGLFFDWDMIDGSGANDIASWDSIGNFGFVDHLGASPTHFVGAALLSSTNYGFFAIDNDQAVSGNPWGIYDGFSDNEKWLSLSSGIGRKNAGPGDVGFTVSGGSFNIAANDSINVAFAILAADNLNELRTSVANARARYNTLTDINDNNILLPKEFFLSQNYPNPFNPTTKISFQLPVTSHVSLKIYDILGNEVANLVNEEKKSGIYELDFDARNLTSGIYFYRITARSSDDGETNFTQTNKMILLR